MQMNKLYFKLLLAIGLLSLSIVSCYADETEAVAEAEAEAEAEAVAEVTVDDTDDIDDGEDAEDAAATEIETPSGLSEEEMIKELRSLLELELSKNPQLYDATDIENVLNGDQWHTLRYLQQRSYKIHAAVRLALKTLKWRNEWQVNKLRAEQFACDLFQLGLIFEHGQSTPISTNFASPTAPAITVPVIWLRLGALGKAVRKFEHPTVRRVAANTVRLVSSVARKSRRALGKIRKSLRRARSSKVEQSNYENSGVEEKQEVPQLQLRNNAAATNNPAFHHILSAILWWIRDWEEHHPSSKAILMLDFENSNDIFSSRSMSQWIMKLDDHFPALFTKIIGYRFKGKLSARNGLRLGTFRGVSASTTDGKTIMLKRRKKLAKHVQRFDAQGKDILPEYIGGQCRGFFHESPPNCAVDALTLHSESNFDVRTYQMVVNSFYKSCEAKRSQFLNLSRHY